MTDVYLILGNWEKIATAINYETMGMISTMLKKITHIQILMELKAKSGLLVPIFEWIIPAAGSHVQILLFDMSTP